VCTLWNGEHILPYDKRLCAQCCCLYLVTKHSVLFKTSIKNPSTLNFYKTIKIFLAQAQNCAFVWKLPPIFLLQEIQILVHCEVWRFPWANASSHTKVNFLSSRVKRRHILSSVFFWRLLWKANGSHTGNHLIDTSDPAPRVPGIAAPTDREAQAVTVLRVYRHILRVREWRKLCGRVIRWSIVKSLILSTVFFLS